MASISHCHCEGWSSNLPVGAKILCIRGRVVFICTRLLSVDDVGSSPTGCTKIYLAQNKTYLYQGVAARNKLKPVVYRSLEMVYLNTFS